MSTNGSSYAGSVASSRSSASMRARAERDNQEGQNDDLLERRSPLENGIFGVLFTLSKENSETRIHIRWVLVKILLDAWQLFTTVINPAKQGWSINADGTAWAIVSVLNFTWLGDLGYGAYLAMLYAMVALLAFNVVLCVWVAWCFKEHKFPVVWPIKVLRVFSSVFFQAFDVTSLNMLQLGISCNFTGDDGERLHFRLLPSYSCTSTPHILHAIVSALSLVLFVTIALLLNMAEVEVNPLSRRPLALGHSGAEVMAFAIKVLLTLVDVFIGWNTVAACVYTVLALALAYETLRWSAHLVPWVNFLKGGVSMTICWCCITLMLLVFKPGVKMSQQKAWADAMTLTMLVGLAPAFATGAAFSYFSIKRMTRKALGSIAHATPDVKLEDVCDNLDDPRDVEIVSRCCRVWKDRYTLDPEAVNKAHQVIKIGLAMFPSSAYMVLLHGNFMIDVLGVSQTGGSRIEDARKLNPSLMCRFIMFVRQQQATQKAAGSHANDGASMDLLGYVEYQRKQRMVVRLHREALQAMCNFWRALDASRVSFMHLSKALGKIESSVSQAQQAYRLVLESYGSNPKLVRLYGKFLQTIKNDPWRATEYFAEADRLEELKSGDSRGPLLPDGTPLGRMDEMSSAVMVINASGEIQMANRHTHVLFGYKRGLLEGKPIGTLLAPHMVRLVSERLTRLVSASSMAMTDTSPNSALFEDQQVVGMHYDRVAFRVKLSLRKVSGVGEDSTFIVLLDPVAVVEGTATLWVSSNGTVAACDPQFTSHFGWRSLEVNGSNLLAFVVVSPEAQAGTGDLEVGASTTAIRNTAPGQASGQMQIRAQPQPNTQAQKNGANDSMARLLAQAREASVRHGQDLPPGLRCLVAHKYEAAPVPCTMTLSEGGSPDMPILELQIKMDQLDPAQLLVVNRKGSILHASPDLVPLLKDVLRPGHTGPRFGAAHAGDSNTRLGAGAGMGAGGGAGAGAGVAGGGGGQNMLAPSAEELVGYTLSDFLPVPWKDMHTKLLKDTTPMSPDGRSLWSCRKAGSSGATLELRSAAGRPLLMQVAVSTLDVSGEVNHVIRLAKSSLPAALDERRMRLSISAEGLILGVSGGAPREIFGLEPSQVVGRGLWEVVQEVSVTAVEGARASTPGPHLIISLVSQALKTPGRSWRVNVTQPQRPKRGAIMEMAAAVRLSQTKHAIMQIFVQVNDGDEAPDIFVDLWPLNSVTGVLELDPLGRIRGVLEDALRPAGLLFGLPAGALLGTQLSSLVTLPQGRLRVSDLLTVHGAVKSSLKATKKEASVKVGPVHVLPAIHVDGQPLTLNVQLVGKPGSGAPMHALLRFHATPMLPTAANSSMALEAGRGLYGPGIDSTSFNPSHPTSAPPPTAIQMRSAMSISLAAAATEATKLQLDSAAAPGTPPVAPGAGGGSDDADDLRIPASVLALSPLPPQLAPIGSYSSGGGQGATGYSDTLLDTGTATVATAVAGSQHITAADLLASVEGGLPLETVIAAAGGAGGAGGGNRAAVAARSKLADLVKSVGAERLSNGGSSGDIKSPVRRPMAAGSGRFGKKETRMKDGGPAGRQGSELPDGSVRPLVAGAAPVQPGGLPGAPAAADLDTLLEEVEKTTAPRALATVEMESVDSDDNLSEKDEAKPIDGKGRISTWVASKGAYYQNSVATGAQSDDDPSRRSGEYSDPGAGSPDMVVMVRSDPVNPLDAKGAEAHDRKHGPAAAAAGPRPEMVGGYQDDDAASEGGQSAMSGQSGNGGAEYKRGKRFRKLAKLMDSSQAQQVQQRFKTHALFTVAVLAIVHVICFALIVVAIEDQRSSMLNLGHNGEVQRFMHQIMIDVRCLDVISKNKTNPILYTKEDAPMFINRIAVSANMVKERLNDMMNRHHDPSSSVMQLFFFTPQIGWNGVDSDGKDMYTNLTMWDFATRFYSLAREVVQQYDTWISQGVYIGNTAPGQFILKSGPDLFTDARKVLDALLYEAAENVHWVDTLQLIFLAVEGTAISSIAACYLAYLLKAVAAQRHKLYATFLVIPLGLTRALASQNTALLVDDEDDEDDDDDDERAAGNVQEENESAEAVAMPKAKRRATLNVSGDADSHTKPSESSITGKPAFVRSLSARSVGNGDLRTLSGDKSPYDRTAYDRRLTSEALDSNGRSRGCWPLRQMWRSLFNRRRVAPLPHSTSQAANNPKRKLKDDSHETLIMMLPFVFWSAVVVTIYAVAVVQMQGVVDVVAIHSVSNFMSARTYRTIYYSQELAVVEDPALLPVRRQELRAVLTKVRDAWYTLQLGKDAYLALGPEAERFPLVKAGLSYASPELTNIFYGVNACHRQPEHLPCVDPTNRFYQVTHSGLDSIMQQFMMHLSAMASNKSMVPMGLAGEQIDFIYNVGGKDLADGTVAVEIAHYDTITLTFRNILILHVILFLVLWIVVAGFLIFLLFPLLRRITKERRRIAELMSQLPLELDVEKLVARALGTTTGTPGAAAGAPGATGAGAAGGAAPGRNISNGGDVSEDEVDGKGADATSKWKAIIRSASTNLQSPGTKSGRMGSMRKA